MGEIVSAAALKAGLEWIGFLLILGGVLLLVKHFTLDMRLEDMDGGLLGRRTRRAAFFAALVAAGLLAQRLAASLGGTP